MALPVIVARNQIQKTNKRTIVWTNDTVQPTTWYTCPTGKIAICKGQVSCIDTGAAATGNFQVGGIIMAIWAATGGDVAVLLPTDLAENVLFPFEVNLEAGDTIVTDQSSGTNAQFKLQMMIEEFNI